MINRSPGSLSTCLSSRFEALGSSKGTLIRTVLHPPLTLHSPLNPGDGYLMATLSFNLAFATLTGFVGPLWATIAVEGSDSDLFALLEAAVYDKRKI